LRALIRRIFVPVVLFITYSIRNGIESRSKLVISRKKMLKSCANFCIKFSLDTATSICQYTMALNVLGLYKKVKSREGIFKLLRSRGIDSKESIHSAYVKSGGPVRQPYSFSVPIASIDCLKLQHWREQCQKA
jgi:hypothetical protein